MYVSYYLLHTVLNLLENISICVGGCCTSYPNSNTSKGREPLAAEKVSLILPQRP